MKDIVNLTLKLFVICAVAAAALGLTFAVTKAPIEQGNRLRAEEARKVVLSSVDAYEAIDMMALQADGTWQENEGTAVQISEAYFGINDGKKAGMTVKVTTKGYNPGIEMTVGFKPDGTVEALSIGSHEETPGLGANATKPEFTDMFKDKMPKFGVAGEGSGEPIDALTSATYTTYGIVNGANVAYDFFVAVNGGE